MAKPYKNAIITQAEADALTKRLTAMPHSYKNVRAHKRKVYSKRAAPKDLFLRKIKEIEVICNYQGKVPMDSQTKRAVSKSIKCLSKLLNS